MAKQETISLRLQRMLYQKSISQQTDLRCLYGLDISKIVSEFIEDFFSVVLKYGSNMVIYGYSGLSIYHHEGDYKRLVDNSIVAAFYIEEMDFYFVCENPPEHTSPGQNIRKLMHATFAYDYSDSFVVKCRYRSHPEYIDTNFREILFMVLAYEHPIPVIDSALLVST